MPRLTTTPAAILFAAFSLLWSADSAAWPNMAAGDVLLRHDIERLADAGIITGPISSWPLAWDPIANDIRRATNLTDLPPDLLQSLARVYSRAEWEAREGEARLRAFASGAKNATRIRSFQATPRDRGDVGGGIDWAGNWLSFSLNAQIAYTPADGDDLRADGSEIAALFGNYTFSVNTLDRWWGPAWDGSLILGNNARPIPAFSIERNFTTPFASKWLRWIGPWDVAVHFGRFEADRHVPNARFFAMRFNFRPIPSLEIGLSRAAQWCGDGRPCDLDTFVDLFLGNDNVGDAGIGTGNEPGNQLAGFDFRWSMSVLDRLIALYGQIIGEDEAGGFPSHYLGQFGLEASGLLGTRWSYRWFGEYSATSCAFLQSEDLFNCAYNHGIYRSGYRFHGRTVGHAYDNDSRMISTGIVLANEKQTQWHMLIRYGTLNRGGPPDSRNSLTPTPQDLASLDLTYAQVFKYGRIEIGMGIERTDDKASGMVSNTGRAFLRWRSSY